MKTPKKDIISQVSKVDRPKLGKSVPIEIFRVFRHYTQIYAKDLLGDRAKNILFINAGKELGKSIGLRLLDKDLGMYIDKVKKFVEQEKIGILKVVEVSNEKLVFQLDECITCAGMDYIGERICFFEVGIVAGIVEAFLNKKVLAQETKCNANGENVCEVTVYLK
ncbi:MAG: 4-vinyl reductase [Persephonella sp.]|nr:MAG: 4-vinyl reductase [Persephonella sp.]RUM59964.1 MAG: 4-vinyl reductase [Persephonella sp.]